MIGFTYECGLDCDICPSTGAQRGAVVSLLLQPHIQPRLFDVTVISRRCECIQRSNKTVEMSTIIWNKITSEDTLYEINFFLKVPKPQDKYSSTLLQGSHFSCHPLL